MGISEKDLISSSDTTLICFRKPHDFLMCVWLAVVLSQRNLQLKRHHSCYTPQSVHLLFFKATPGLNGAPLNEEDQALCDEQAHVTSVSSCPFLSLMLFHIWLRMSL